MYLVCAKQASINLIHSSIKLGSHPAGFLISSHWVGKWINQILAPLQTIPNSLTNESELWVRTAWSCDRAFWRNSMAFWEYTAHRGALWRWCSTNYMGCSWRPHLAHGQIRAPAHPGFSKRPGQWVGIEHRTIASVREDLGLRLHANFVGDIAEQSFIYKPSARLIDAFNASIVWLRHWCDLS